MSYTTNDLSHGSGGFPLAVPIVKLYNLSASVCPPFQVRGPSRKKKAAPCLCSLSGKRTGATDTLLVNPLDLINVRADLRSFLLPNQTDDEVAFAHRVIRNIA